MSQSCSSLRDLNIAPLAVTAVTHRLMATFWPGLYKRDLKLTWTLWNVFHQSSHTEAETHLKPLRYQLDRVSWFCFHSHMSDMCLMFHQKTGGRQMGGSHNNWTVGTVFNTWCAARGQSWSGRSSEATYMCCFSGRTCWCCRPMLSHVWAVCCFTLFTFSSPTMDCFFAVLHWWNHPVTFWLLQTIRTCKVS